jgi:hypothetical protein
MALYKAPAQHWPTMVGWLDASNSTQLGLAICLRAMHDVGILEVPLASNRGVRIDRYAKRAGSPLGSWWCAIWVGAVWADCGAKVPKNYPGTDYWLPHLLPGGPAAKPKPGDAILYGLRKRGPVMKDMDAHHIGIVVRITPMILTIEGNRGYAGTTNNGVAVDIGPMARRDVLGYVRPERAA